MGNNFHRFVKTLAGLFRGLDSIEGVVVMLLAAVLIVGLPVVRVIKLFKVGNSLGSILVGCLWAGTIAYVVRDILRGKFGAVSWIVIVLWLLTSIAITVSVV